MPYRQAELRFLLGHSRAKCVICVAGDDDSSPAAECVRLGAGLPGLEHVIAVGNAPAGALAFEELIASDSTGDLPVLGGDDEFLLLYTASAIVPYADEMLGERACIFVQAVPGAQVTLEDITGALHAAGLAKFKWPERLEFVDVMPLTPTRKIIRSRLQERLAERR